MVPDEGIEPPTFGLQNRCSTAELIRPSDTDSRCLFGTCPGQAQLKRMIRFAFPPQGPPITKPLHYRCAIPALGHRDSVPIRYLLEPRAA
jgi:hypothetical protein